MVHVIDLSVTRWSYMVYTIDLLTKHVVSHGPGHRLTH